MDWYALELDDEDSSGLMPSGEWLAGNTGVLTSDWGELPCVRRGPAVTQDPVGTFSATAELLHVVVTLGGDVVVDDDVAE